MDPRTLLVVQFFCTSALTGLIWLVQLVSYPGFLDVGEEEFREYHRAHSSRITFVVAPLMLAELGTAVLFWSSAPGRYAVAGLVLVGIVWASTALLQVPCHRKLSSGYDARTIRFLIQSNWLRTIAWTARSLVLGSLLVKWL